MQKFLNPKNDIAFKRLFGSEQNKDILIGLLNEVLKNQLHQKIKEVSFLSPIQNPEILAKKQSIVDVLCKDQDGCQYIIEMQVATQEGFQKRAQYYASKAFISQMKVGEKYQHLKEVIFLAFTDFSIFPQKKEYKSEHVILDKKTKERDLDCLSFTFVDLVKFGKTRPKNIEDLSLEEKFYYFLRNATDISSEDFEILISQNKILKKAFKELSSVHWTDEELQAYEKEEKRERDNIAILDAAKNQGRSEGRKEGREEGRSEGRSEGRKEGRKEGIMELLKQGIITGDQAEKVSGVLDERLKKP